jgi:DNA-binding beta-propeller fold protein YncE
VRTLAGSATSGFVDGALSSARFDYPRGIVVTSAGPIFISDGNNNAIRKISAGSSCGLGAVMYLVDVRWQASSLQ